MKGNFLILSCSVWDVYFSCLVLESVYYNVDMCMMWALVLLGSFCVPFTNSLIKFYFITIIINTKSVGTTRHCSLVSSTPSQSTELVWVCLVLVLSLICVLFTNSLMKFYFITIIHCSLVSSTPSQSIGLVFGCVLFSCWVSFVFLYPIPWWSSISSW